MSLILEALKKSEQQRQREKAPSLQSIHQPVPVAVKKSALPWWLFAAFIVICNVAFFGYWFWREHNTPSPAVSVATSAEPVSAVNNTTSTSAAAQTAEIPQPQPEFTPISPRGMINPSTINTSSGSIEGSQRIQEISELPDNVRNNLPAMTFSFHVYSDNPEQRTIIINDRRIREGEEISRGLRLQSITQDGVILLFEQHRIHIGVLSDW